MEFEVLPATALYLHNRYKNSKKTQEANGVRFDLSEQDYQELIVDHPHALKRICIRHARWLKRGKPGKFCGGYVLTWRNRAAKLGGVMNKETACYASAQVSIRNCRFMKGEIRGPVTRERISAALTGTTRPDEVKQKIAASQTGKKYSEESKAKRKATWAAKRAVKEAANA